MDIVRSNYHDKALNSHYWSRLLTPKDTAESEVILLQEDFTPPAPSPSPASPHRQRRKEKLQHRLFQLNNYKLSNLQSEPLIRKHSDIIFFRTIISPLHELFYAMTKERDLKLSSARQMCLTNRLLSSTQITSDDEPTTAHQRYGTLITKIALSEALEIKEYLNSIPDSVTPLTSLFLYISENIDSITDNHCMQSSMKPKPSLSVLSTHILIFHLGLLGHSSSTFQDSCPSNSCFLHSLHFAASLPYERQFLIIHEHITSLLRTVVRFETITLTKPESLIEANLVSQFTKNTLAHMQKVNEELELLRASEQPMRRKLKCARQLPPWLFFSSNLRPSRL